VRSKDSKAIAERGSLAHVGACTLGKCAEFRRKLADPPQDRNFVKIQNVGNRIFRWDGIDFENQGRYISLPAGIALEDVGM
jgi:hypothetical protein